MMKTKQIAPWNLKPGMEVQVIDNSRPIRCKVKSVRKGRNRWNGETTWTVTFEDDWHLPAVFHGKGRLGVEKPTVVLP